MQPLKIVHRYHFSSQLKRMTVIAGYTIPGFTEPKHLVLVKGAPETIKPMYGSAPKNYDQTYQQLAQAGARVLAMGIKEVGSLSHQEVISYFLFSIVYFLIFRLEIESEKIMKRT